MRAAHRLASQIVNWFQANQRDLPWRRTRDPYAIWVSEIMLQQTQVKTVIPFWERWMRELPTIAALANAPEERVLKLWEGLGYYSRARNLQKAAQLIVTEHSGKFPDQFDLILELPGIGRYTAGAIASIAFGQPKPIVDGNVARVLARFLGLRGEIKEELWTNAAALVEAAQPACSELNQGLMELGATVCMPREPLCKLCPIQSRCFAFKNGKTAELPEAPARVKATARLFRASLIEKNGRILLRKRTAGEVNAGFWEMPNSEVTTTNTPAGDPVCIIKHTITRYRMSLEVYREQPRENLNCKWFQVSDLNSIPMVSSHAKALAKIGLLPARKIEPAKRLMD